MPFLDVTEVLFDPDFAQVLEITRRTNTVNAQGRTTITPSTLSPVGVITAGVPPEFQQGPDSIHSKNSITINCTLQLLDSSTTALPDYVIFNGNTYIVKKALPFSNFGAGFYCSYADLVNLQTVPND